MTLTTEQKRHFRDELRNARAAALADAEGYMRLIVSIERLGKYLHGKSAPIGKLVPHLTEVAKASPLAVDLPARHNDWHASFEVLLRQLQQARNAAVHEGALARHLTGHATKVAVVLEDALMANLDQVGDFMVRNPVRASRWQPLSFARQTMLEGSFSYLPMDLGSDSEPKWRLLSDLNLARFVRSNDRKEAMAMTVDEALSKGLEVVEPYVCNPDSEIPVVLRECKGHPVLVVAMGRAELLGIVTPFDLL